MQGVLPISLIESYTEDSFIISCSNLDAYKAIMYNNWPDNRLLIIGEEGSGKTHLINVWCGKHPSHANDYIVLENIEEYAASIEAEKRLLYTINLAIEHGMKLIMSARRCVKYSISDLCSRLNATYTVCIKNPDEYLLKGIIKKKFNDLQLQVPQSIIDYIAVRIERRFICIKQVVERINLASLIYQHRFTIPFIRRVLVACDLINKDVVVYEARH